jgi:RNA polymerase subunit RPABC4/transcription elongation factor Spt4
MLVFLALFATIIIVPEIFGFSQRLSRRQNGQGHGRGSRKTNVPPPGNTNCPKCREVMGVSSVFCPSCAHDVAAFNLGHAAVALESLQRQIVARRRRAGTKAIVLYAIFISFALGGIVFGFFADSRLIMAAGFIALAVELLFLSWDLKSGSRYTFANRRRP